MSRRTTEKPLADQEPKPPFPGSSRRRPARIEARSRAALRGRELSRGRQSSKARSRSSPAATRASGARSRCSSRAKAPTSRSTTCPKSRATREETQRGVEAEGRRCLLLPGDLTDAKFCNELVDHDGETSSASSTSSSRTPRTRTARTARRSHRRGARADVQDQRLRLLPPRAGRARAHEARRRDHRHELGDGHPGLAQAARLFGDQGRDQRVHQVARAGPHRQGHPRQRDRAGTGVDAAQSLRRGRARPRRSRTSARTAR